MKPTKCPAREKKMRQEKRKEKGGENFCFLRMLDLLKLISFASGAEGREVYDL